MSPTRPIEHTERRRQSNILELFLGIPQILWRGFVSFGQKYTCSSGGRYAALIADCIVVGATIVVASGSSEEKEVVVVVAAVGQLAGLVVNTTSR